LDDTDKGKTEERVSVPLCSPQIPHGLAWDRTRASRTRQKKPRDTKLIALFEVSEVSPARPSDKSSILSSGGLPKQYLHMQCLPHGKHTVRLQSGNVDCWSRTEHIVTACFRVPVAVAAPRSFY
jgi:hypothetical protein